MYIGENKQMMRAPIKGLSLLLVVMVIAAYILPNHQMLLLASSDSSPSLKIYDLKQKGTSLQPGDTFSVTAQVEVINGEVLQLENKGLKSLYVIDASASGSVDSDKAHVTADNGGELDLGGAVVTVTVSGLVYTGGDKEMKLSLACGDGKNENDVLLYGTSEKSLKLSARTDDEMEDTLVIEKQDNIVVKPGSTQNISVNVKNTASFTVNQAELVLSLDKKTEGLELKTSKVTLKSVKSKSTQKAAFSISVGEDVNAGIYSASIYLYGESYPINIQVDSSVVPSTLEVSAKSSKVFTPGNAQEAVFTIENVGQRDAKNIRVEVVNSDSISIADGSNVKHLDKIGAGNSQSISLKLCVANEIKTATVPVQIKLTYLSSTGEEKEDSQYVYLNTNASMAASEVTIGHVTSPTGTFGVDENFTIGFNVSSSQGAQNIKVSVKGDEGIVPKSQNLFYINKLAKGQSEHYTVTFAATRTAESSSHPLAIEVEYGGGENPITISQYGSVSIYNPKKDEEEADKDSETKKGMPRVIVGEYTVEPMIVKAGEAFQLQIGFLNANKSKTVYNFKANLTVIDEGDDKKGNVFTPVKASNTFYIDELGPKETETKTIQLYTLPSAAARTYDVTLEMVYEDADGNEVKDTEMIGIPVTQPTNLEVGDFFAESGEAGMPLNVSATIYNRGKTDVTNMMIYIEGEGFTVEENKYFVGNFTSGSTETYERTLIADEAGTLSGELVIEYEDTTGTIQEIRYPFELEIEEAMMMEDMGEYMPEEEEAPSNRKPLYIGLAVAGVIVLVTFVAIIHKKRKAKKEAFLLDEDD